MCVGIMVFFMITSIIKNERVFLLGFLIYNLIIIRTYFILYKKTKLFYI